MMDDFKRLEQFTGDKAIETVLKDHPDLRLLWERRPILKSPRHAPNLLLSMERR
ncbi:MAG: hypothetical protein H5T98_11105 [Syntrophomonadaceae bacterium]|nr:hypothetical protein [Syntrophomonadaceae bacterium]